MEIWNSWPHLKKGLKKIEVHLIFHFNLHFNLYFNLHFIFFFFITLFLFLPIKSFSYLGPGEMRTAQVSILTSEVSTIDVSKRNEEKPMLNIDLGLAQGIEEGDHAVVYGDSEQWLGRAFCVQSDFNKSLWKFYRYDEKKKIIEAQQAVKLKGIPLSDGP